MSDSDATQRNPDDAQPAGAIPEPAPGAGSRGRWGPGWIVAAAFIGPGTVTTASVAGARFGAQLLWALLFGVLATMALQEMAARLGLVTGRGLGEAIRERFRRSTTRIVAVALVIGAIGIGNAAYQTGNLLGAGLGLVGLAGGTPGPWAAGIAAVAFGLLWTGSYRVVERALAALVAVMGAVFVVSAIAVRPSVADVLTGLLVPSMPSGAAVIAAALVGTTVVPYNLFLHAASVREKWDGVEDLPTARRDLVVSIAVGGAIGMAVVVAAAGAGASGEAVESAADMARALEPALGRWAEALFALGLLAAGTTSAITAPLAAAWAVAGALGWRRELDAPGVRVTWISVLTIGTLFATTGIRPVAAIVFAQAANGLLLPAVAAFLVVVANDRERMGRWANGRAANALAAVVVAVATLLGSRALLGALGVL
ncbi:MAG: Nramp family divalent metal transporter [Gemmatimonadota bacterium]|nr:Nramp family divalent metal transporter [Gemmatimonadota bacterium]